MKREPQGLCSNYLCDLKKGDKVQVTGPFGATFLMPDDPSANIIMICTGTGSAPFRGFTERRRRTMRDAPGRMMIFSARGGRRNCRISGRCRRCRTGCCASTSPIRACRASRRPMCRTACARRADEVVGVSASTTSTHIYICGLKGMESGVDEALADICRSSGIDWAALRADMRAQGRYHVETY